MSNIKLLHQESSVTPFTLGMIHCGFHQKRHFKYLKPLYFKNSFIIYKDLKIDWYGDWENFTAMGDIVLEKIKKNEGYSSKVLKDVKRVGNKLFKINKEIDKVELSHLSNAQLAKYIKNLYKTGTAICDYGWVAVISDLRHYKLSNFLKEIIRSKEKNKDINYYFSTLITPFVPTLMYREKKSIYRLAFDVCSERRLLSLFKNNSPSYILKNIYKFFPSFSKQFGKMYKNFRWLTFGHLGPGKSEIDYIKEIKNILKKEKSIDVNSIEKELQDTYFLIKQLEKELGLSKEEKKYFQAARDFGLNKAIRYEMLMYTFFNFNRLLKEIARHTNLENWMDLYFMTVDEILDLLINNKKVKPTTILERRKLSLGVIRREKLKIISGEKASKFIERKVPKEKEKGRITVIHGSVAFRGKVRGKVRIVNLKEEMSKVKKGDVLVAIQTNPDLLPAMKKASAFITDIGGITSHAAIVARELKKPCIIGTKIATQVLKDGDLVEVDAVKGDIKILKRINN